MGKLEGKEREQETENLFEKIMTENLLCMMKEIRHTSPGKVENPKQDELKEAHTKTHHN